MKKSTYYLGLILVILIVGVFVAIEISRRISNDTVTDGDRHMVGKENTELVTIGKAPSFSFTNQNNKTITNNDYKGKVYVVEFFSLPAQLFAPLWIKIWLKYKMPLKMKIN